MVCASAGRRIGGAVARTVRQSTLLLVGVFFLSPLYSNLTKAVSDDTIVAASTWLLLAHLYMHDYFFVKSVTDKVTGSLSLACGVAASVLLASRLARPDKVVCSASPSQARSPSPCIGTCDRKRSLCSLCKWPSRSRPTFCCRSPVSSSSGRAAQLTRQWWSRACLARPRSSRQSARRSSGASHRPPEAYLAARRSRGRGLRHRSPARHPHLRPPALPCFHGLG